jgi:N-acetylgalactosamine kinase
MSSSSSPNVPVVNVPQELRESERIVKLLDHFSRKFETKPSFLVRVPGRVNLIGEHIDYCGYSVFPMALKQDIVMAVSLNNSSTINLTNLEIGEYSDFKTDVNSIEFPKPPKWYHYFQCGYKGVVDKYCPGKQLPGINVAVHGNIPPSSGLSSSSAMVCASAFATIISYLQMTSKSSENFFSL